MDDKKRNILLATAKTISQIIQKADTENEEFVKSIDVSKEQKSLMLDSLEKFEKQIHKFLMALRKKYIVRINNLPMLLKKRKKEIKKSSQFDDKGNLTENALDELVEIFQQYIFVDSKEEIEKLKELYDAFAIDFFKGISAVVASNIKGSKAKKEDELTSKAEKWLNSHKIKFAKEVSKTTHDTILSILRTGLKEGAGMNTSGDSLIKLLPDFFNMKELEKKRKLLSSIKSPNLFNYLQEQVDKDINFQYYRARRIARTEMLAANGAATLEGYRRSKVVVGKEWMCAMSENSRKAHKKANGQVVPIDEPFIINGEKLMHPGDSSLGASAENVIQCRCTMRAKLRYEERKR